LLDQSTYDEVKKNIFPPAWPALRGLDKAQLHRDLGKPNSSQALAIDVFGFLKLIDQSERNRALDAIALSLGLPTGGDWSIELEWTDGHNLLNEKQKSQIDAVARSAHSLIFIECKFTEKDGGKCSQTSPREGKKQCDGNYNYADGKKARCTLTAKKIRYWDSIPQVFDLDANVDHEPCPFAGSWYQWMRNIILCWETARRKKLAPGFAIAYADSPFLSIAKKEFQCLDDLLRRNTVSFDKISYQKIIDEAIELAHSNGSDASQWCSLKIWVADKIKYVEDKIVIKDSRLMKV